MIPVNQATPHTSLERVTRSVYHDHSSAEPVLVNGERVHGGLAYDPDMSTADFLEWAERDSRAKALALEMSFAGRLPQGFTDYYYPPTPREVEKARRVERACLLAPDPETFMALVAGKAVHRSRLRKDVLDTLERSRRHQRV